MGALNTRIRLAMRFMKAAAEPIPEFKINVMNNQQTLDHILEVGGRYIFSPLR